METQRIGKILKGYTGLSVREATGQKILKDVFNLDATLVCDPTILHANYEEFTKGLIQKNEVICYSLSVSSSSKLLAIRRLVISCEHRFAGWESHIMSRGPNTHISLMCIVGLDISRAQNLC